MKEQDMSSIVIIWRGKQLTVDVSQNSVVEELGKKLQKLTNVKPDTMKLLVPQSTKKNSKLITPFSDAHSSMNLKETGIFEGKAIRMLGVFDDEIQEVSHINNKPDLRIAGFEEEEKRLNQLVNSVPAYLKLPQGTYIFCDFRALHIPGAKLNPPPSEALRRMHMLACDPGIIAIMNKYRWRVGVMTEMAPVGYVGISPKCILGFNKNQGEEISLRIRTDDLKGFRKYDSVKKTLLHELAHMVHSEHDASFFALDKQLNKEAISLDWTKSRSHTLSGQKSLYHYEDDFLIEETNLNGQKLGGTWNSSTTARASSVAAAYSRLLNASTSGVEGSEASENACSLNEGQLPNVSFEPDPDDGELKGSQDGDTLGIRKDVPINTNIPYYNPLMPVGNDEPDPDDCFGDERMSKDDSDDSDLEIVLSDDTAEAIKSCEPDPDDSTLDNVNMSSQGTSEPEPDETGILGRTMDAIQTDSMLLGKESGTGDHAKEEVLKAGNRIEQDSDCSVEIKNALVEPDPDDHMDVSNGLEIIEEPVTAICTRLRKAIEMLRSEVTPAEATLTIQTLFKIIRNVIDHPDEVKFRKLRKANPQFQRNIAKFKAAMEVLAVVGFCEDAVLDEVGRVETYMVLKRNDPGLLWLAKSSLEEFIS